MCLSVPVSFSVSACVCVLVSVSIRDAQLGHISVHSDDVYEIYQTLKRPTAPYIDGRNVHPRALYVTHVDVGTGKPGVCDRPGRCHLPELVANGDVRRSNALVQQVPCMDDGSTSNMSH